MTWSPEGPWDAAVVGAGPAGALVARELARGGASVLLLERQRLPRWKVCGACLGPGAQQVLADVGLGELPRRLGARPLEWLVLRSGGRSARVGLRGSAALSRAALDEALVQAARADGAELLDEAHVRLDGPATDEVRALRVRRRGVERRLHARLVIDATGLGANLPAPDGPAPAAPAAGSRVGLGALFGRSSSPIAFGEVHMAIGRFGYVGLVRLEDGRVDAAAAVDAERLRRGSPDELVRALLEEADLPPLAGPPLLGWKGTPALTRGGSPVGDARLFRLGDASGYVEPFTGEGIGWALGGARALAPLAAQALERWDPRLLRAWEAHHAGRMAPSRRLCRALARALRRPRWVGIGIGLLEHAPVLARPLVRRAGRAPAPLRPVGAGRGLGGSASCGPRLPEPSGGTHSGASLR
jgi:flavin-dependent dehydrogenase